MAEMAEMERQMRVDDGGGGMQRKGETTGGDTETKPMTGVRVSGRETPTTHSMLCGSNASALMEYYCTARLVIRQRTIPNQ